MMMNWKKSRLTVHRWESLGFVVLETLDIDGRPFTLKALADEDQEPLGFSTLAEAQAHAALLNDLAITKANNDTLRAELARLRDGGSWERHPTPEGFEPPLDAAAARMIESALDRNDGRGIPAALATERNGRARVFDGGSP